MNYIFTAVCLACVQALVFGFRPAAQLLISPSAAAYGKTDYGNP